MKWKRGKRQAGNGRRQSPEARGWRYGRSGTMAADSRRRRARWKAKRSGGGSRGGESEAKALAVAERGAGELCEGDHRKRIAGPDTGFLTTTN